MPTTYMNDSGLSIRSTLDWFGLEVHQLIVLVDDIDLPLGKLRLRSKGSSGGHNGLRSTIQHLQTQNFCRIRIGIGSPSNNPSERKELTVRHVLGTFNQKEAFVVNRLINEVIFGLDLMQNFGIERAGNHLNSFQPKVT